jgi:hypothetical protein
LGPSPLRRRQTFCFAVKGRGLKKAGEVSVVCCGEFEKFFWMQSTPTTTANLQIFKDANKNNP